ncbi:helix-turn-helix domain-containing protein, partial [Streptomyces sp. NPDC050732]|uniref:helix-turn-helix domain-containing protein n=1 Tax=Streptomyces sp. NPDC050732 TaxID=3154632 RepID=UPI00344612E3
MFAMSVDGSARRNCGADAVGWTAQGAVGFTRYTRQRAGYIRLLDQGRCVAEVAGVLECHPVTVRAAVHRFDKDGVA